MKTIQKLSLLFFLLVILSGINTINAQDADKAFIVAELPKMNVIYIGVDNLCKIAIAGVEQNKIVVEGEKCTVTGGNGDFIIRVSVPGKASINIFELDNNGQKKLLGTKEFRVKRVPDPVAKIADYKGGAITKAEVLSAGKLDVVLENFDFDLRFKMVSYSISANVESNGDYFEVSATTEGTEFSEKQIELINKVEAGKKFYVEDIKVMGPDGSIRNLGALAFLIKD